MQSHQNGRKIVELKAWHEKIKKRGIREKGASEKALNLLDNKRIKHTRVPSSA